MKRKILLIFFIIILSQINIYSIVTNYGCFDEAKSLESKKFSIGGFNTIIFKPITTYIDLYTNEIGIIDYSVNKIHLIPIIHLGVTGRFGLKHNIEIGFNHLISSPSSFWQLGNYLLMSLYGDFSFKKSIKIRDNKYFAYKVNLGINWIIPDCGVDIIQY